MNILSKAKGNADWQAVWLKPEDVRVKAVSNQSVSGGGSDEIAHPSVGNGFL